jgi:succinyl-diaminopimelate desuccinylase
MTSPTSPIDALLRQVKTDEAAIVGVCRDLVRIPSENPPGDTTEVFGYVRTLLDKWGLPVTLHEPAPGRQNLIAAWDTGRPGKHLVLNGHLDVFPAGPRALWDRDPFSGDVEGGRLHGRGVTDMKAGCTALLFTLAYVRQFEASLGGKVTLTLVCDEENFAEHGARALVLRYPEVLQADALLNGEPGTPDIIRIGDKGLVWAEVTFRTPGGHGAFPHVSESAITRAMRFLEAIKPIERWKSPVPAPLARHVTRIQKVTDRGLGKGATAVARRYVVHFGTIRGGIKVNMIASECTAEVDVRIPMGGRVAPVVAALKKAARQCGGRLTVVNTIEPNWTSSDASIARIVKGVVEGLGGPATVFGFGIGCNDARLWRYAGVPAVIYGPTPHNMGRANEYVEVRELLRATTVHAVTALRFLARPA